MPNTTQYESCDAVIVSFPFTDQPAAKKHPATIVSSAAYHREHPDLILMAITSRKQFPPAFGEMTITQWEAGHLLKPSVIKAIFATIENGLVLRKLGNLAHTDRNALYIALQLILGE